MLFCFANSPPSILSSCCHVRAIVLYVYLSSPKLVQACFFFVFVGASWMQDKLRLLLMMLRVPPWPRWLSCDPPQDFFVRTR